MPVLSCRPCAAAAEDVGRRVLPFPSLLSHLGCSHLMCQHLQQHQKTYLCMYLGFFPTLAGFACWMLEGAASHGNGHFQGDLACSFLCCELYEDRRAQNQVT